MGMRLSKTTVALHWLVALMFIGVFAVGWYMHELPKGPEKGELIGLHKSFGFVVLLIALVRLSWRLKEGALPALGVLQKWQKIAAKTAHHLLLLATILMPVSGIAMSMGGGRPLEVFGVELIGGGEKMEWLQSLGHTIHGGFANIVIAAFVLHLVGAFAHQFYFKDGTISRMLGRTVNKPD